MAIITARCIRCRQELRENGTCQNPDCVRYTTATVQNSNEENEKDNK